jgi:hypothetical protein
MLHMMIVKAVVKHYFAMVARPLGSVRSRISENFRNRISEKSDKPGSGALAPVRLLYHAL